MPPYLLGRWREGEANANTTLRMARDAWAAMKAATASGSSSAIGTAAAQLDDALRTAPVNLESVRAEIGRQQLIRRRLIETELKRALVMRTSIPVADAMNLLNTMMEAFLKIVTDPAQREAIGREYEHLTGGRVAEQDVIDATPVADANGGTA